MTDKEIRELTAFEKVMKRYVLGGGGAVVLALITFYFNTGFTLTAHEQKIEKLEKHTPNAIILEQDVKHMKEDNAIFMRQYQKDRDKIIDLLLEIKEEQ